MWLIEERRDIEKRCRKLPAEIVRKYELWKNIILRHGPEKLREFSGFHDEKLKGDWLGCRSSRLSLKYRVIYTVNNETVTVFVVTITAHKY